MIEIKKDPTKSIRELPSGALLVQTTNDYPRMCLELRIALQEAHSITIVVQNPLVCDWVDNLKRCYLEIAITECDPLQELRDHLGTTSLPPALTPRAVNELGLLNLPKPIEPVTDAKSWILLQLVGKCWSVEMPDPGWQHFVDLASWHLTEASCAGHHRLIQKWMLERRKHWIDNCETYVQEAYHWLLANPHLRAKLLLCRQILLPYGDSQQQDWIRAILGCEHFVPDYIPIRQLPQISRGKSLVAELSEYAKAYWHSQISDAIEIGDALSHMSGEFLGELEAVTRELKRKPEKCNRELVLRLRHHFSLVEGATILLEKIEKFIPPPKPREPQEAWGWDEWALWATQEYLPYREWVHVQKRKDPEVDRYALMYGDWLYERYPVLKNAPEPLVFGVAKRIRQLTDEGYVILWIVIDNLPWVYGLRFVGEMAKHGLMARDNPDIRLSMLPSETETSKRALVGGRLTRDLHPDADYNHLLWDRWGNVIMSYEKNKPSLDGLVSKDATLYLYQYDGLDPIAHRFEVNRESTVQSALQFLAKVIANAVELLRTRFDKIIVMVDSDHGSTLIPKDAKKLDRPLSARGEKDRHRRFVVLSYEVHLNHEDWYILRPAQFGNREIFAIARGYACVEKRPQHYTHGGLTPEETIVPHIEFEPEVMPDWRPLEVVYEGQPIRPGRAQRATFTIRNLNPTRLSDVRLLIQGAESKPITIDAEEQGQIENVWINIPTSVRVPEFVVRAYVRYLAYGRSKSQEVHARIPVRLVAIDTGIDEMFEE